MMAHINPLYTIAQICAVACIVVLVVGIVLTDWEMVYLRMKGKRYRRRFEKQNREFNPEWMDAKSWEETK